MFSGENKIQKSVGLLCRGREVAGFASLFSSGGLLSAHFKVAGALSRCALERFRTNCGQEERSKLSTVFLCEARASEL